MCVGSELPDADYLLGRDWWDYYHCLLCLPVLLLQVRELWVSVPSSTASLGAENVCKIIRECFCAESQDQHIFVDSVRNVFGCESTGVQTGLTILETFEVHQVERRYI